MSRLFIAFFALTLAALALAQPEDDADLFHTVEAGDTLISIAFAYGVTLDQLLTLNDLRPEALLQIGQRLLVIPAGEPAEGDSEPDVKSGDEAASTEIALDGAIERDDLPPAPVVEADAPMRDPADIRPQLCFAVYQDDNQNGMIDPGEAPLPGATIRLLADDDDLELSRYSTDAAAEPICARNLERRLYILEAEPPPGFGLTLSSRLRIDLRTGGRVEADFGAKQGFEPGAVPPLASAGENDSREPAEARSLLRQLSGLFALGMAVIVFFSGLAVSLFVRGR